MDDLGVTSFMETHKSLVGIPQGGYKMTSGPDSISKSVPGRCRPGDKMLKHKMFDRLTLWFKLSEGNKKN